MTRSISGPASIPTEDVYMNSIVPTSAPEIYATMKAFVLTEAFLSCPYAAKLLESERFIKPLLIDVEDISGAKTLTHRDQENYTPLSAMIVIAEKDLKTTTCLYDLAFEIFNAQRTSSVLFQEASIGNVGMDSYARQREEFEQADTQAHFALMKQCGNHWGLPSEELEAHLNHENVDPETDLFLHEVRCHTDFYRQEWIELFQEVYCKKQPDDTRSCETKTTDLCNLDTVRSMSGSERIEFEGKQICKLFPQAHESVKNDPYYRGIVQNGCPELLEKSPQPDHEEL